MKSPCLSLEIPIPPDTINDPVDESVAFTDDNIFMIPLVTTFPPMYVSRAIPTPPVTINEPDNVLVAFVCD